MSIVELVINEDICSLKCLGGHNKKFTRLIRRKTIKAQINANPFNPGIFVLYNKWIPYFRNKLHLQN